MTATSVEKANGTPVASAEPRFDPRALAEAEVIRARAAADAEAARIKAEGEAEAGKIKAAEEAEALRLENEKQRLANERAALRFQREQAEQRAKIEEAEQKRDEIARARQAARQKTEKEQKAAEESAAEVADADDKWRAYAIRFAIVCGIVSLPVQMSFFWNPRAPWMAAAPIMLEGAAWVVHRGARAAVANRRPVWHYRTIVWFLALIAAGVNLYHGLYSFDLGTAAATAFASLAGPGVWDLHEHGRIRKRDGKLTWRQRRAQRKTKRVEAARKAAEEKQRAVEKEAAEKAAAEARKQLDETRAKEFPKVWEHARKLAAALGETTVTEAVWKRAHRDVEGADPSESADIIRMRNAAELRVEAARQKKPVNTLSKTTNAQRAAQMPLGPNRVLKTRATRRRGDTPKYVGAARKQAAITAKNAAKNTRPNAN
ncbi:hypothetical protein ACFZAO_05465 [Streptomyces griseoaurantiacus]|uniref:hypothetical protein n=1 Tax=Streptomyces griseoaurantiacus TaxID=68213 RepID=UPI0036F188A4